MQKIHFFSDMFCDNVLNSLNDDNRYILHYKGDKIDNKNNLKIDINQPTDADAWCIDENKEIVDQIMDVILKHDENIGECTFVVQRLDNIKKSNPHKDRYNFTLVILLNDNFKDGELMIEDIPANLKKGEVLIFNSNRTHYVDKVTEGERYTLLGFLKVKEKNKKTII
jgi:hypothetical protein